MNLESFDKSTASTGGASGDAEKLGMFVFMPELLASWRSASPMRSKGDMVAHCTRVDLLVKV